MVSGRNSNSQAISDSQKCQKVVKALYYYYNMDSSDLKVALKTLQLSNFKNLFISHHSVLQEETISKVAIEIFLL